MVKTSRFGDIEYQEEHVFTLVEGPLGFPEEKEFIILNHPGNGIFKWLQSTKTPELAFVIAEPFYFFPDYSFDIPDEDVNLLQIKDRNKLLIYSILVVPEDPLKITANLKAPIIINGDNRKGKQLVLIESKYKTKHILFEETSEK